MGVEVVERLWPYDGPHHPERVVEAVDAMSSLIRYLTNATTGERATGTLPYAISVHLVINGLLRAVSRLPQLLTQLGEAIRRQAADSSLYDDRGDRPGQLSAQELLQYLDRARRAARALGHELEAASALSAHLGNHPTLPKET